MKRQFKHIEKAEPVMNITRRIAKIDKQLLTVHKDIAELKAQIDVLKDAVKEGVKTKEGLHIPL